MPKYKIVMMSNKGRGGAYPVFYTDNKEAAMRMGKFLLKAYALDWFEIYYLHEINEKIYDGI